METLAPVAFFLVFAAVIGLVVWLVVRTARRKRTMRDPAVGADLARLAGERGWRHEPEVTGYAERFDGHPFHGNTAVQPVFDLVSGSYRGRPFACFQYSPPRSMPPGEQPAEATYLRMFTLELPAPVPRLRLWPAGADPRWMRGFTTGDPEFDKAIAVGTRDQDFATRVLTEPVQRWLRDNPPLAGVAKGSVCFEGNYLLGWYEEKGRFDPNKVEPALEYLSRLLSNVPQDALR